MKRSVILSMSIVAVLALPCLQASRADHSDIVVFDGPRGSWLATVRNGVTLEVIEERDGWKRVRLEGWIAATGTGGEAEAPGASVAPAVDAATAAAPATPTAASAAGRGVTVSGVLLPAASDQSSGSSSGLSVLLVGDLEALDEEHARAGADCRARMVDSQREIDKLQNDYRQQMNSSDNFKEAAERNDRAKKALKRAEQAQKDLLDSCRSTAEHLFQIHAVQRAVSDRSGRFEFDRVPGGKYRIVASDIGGNAPRVWVYECAVAGTGPVVIDPETDRSEMLPFWGLERSAGS